ncbi:MAG: ATP-binding cassette domain-containing protein [Desulfocapsaceae bacterium]|nr:ATP-binding cassette domain-containing protein [Desulfocapsaceae bacterium]
MIHVENLSKYYGEFCAVDQISFDIERGEIVGLLGPNGAGKTTTLRMITGYFRPTSGSIRIKDHSIATEALQIKRLIGYLPESAPLYHNMLVYDYLLYIAGIRGLSQEKSRVRIRELVDLCSLDQIMHKSISELSKGLKQRVGLAHAMMDDPEILVLDEPTSGLDPNQIVEIRDIIKEIGRQKTVILSTHILSEAEATCNRLVIINKGKIVADDTTRALKQRANEEYTLHVSFKEADLAEVEKEISQVNGIRRVRRIETGEKRMLHLKLTCFSDHDIRGEVYAVIRRSDWELREFYRETESLENIFRELTTEV